MPYSSSEPDWIDNSVNLPSIVIVEPTIVVSSCFLVCKNFTPEVPSFAASSSLRDATPLKGNLKSKGPASALASARPSVSPSNVWIWATPLADSLIDLMLSSLNLYLFG